MLRFSQSLAKNRKFVKSVDYEQSLFFLGPSSKTPETRKWTRTWLMVRDERGTPLTKSEEKERLLAVY